MRMARHFVTQLWTSHKPAKLNSIFVYHKGSNPENPSEFECLCNAFIFVVTTKQIMSQCLFVKKGVGMKINSYDYKRSAKRAAIKYDKASLSKN
jgi:hypothetical protein